METIDGTAEANSDYLPMKDTLSFSPGETEKLIDIGIVDDDQWEPDEVSPVF
jgi:solute carrier family 8 (sodium/calcium exchanger)